MRVFFSVAISPASDARLADMSHARGPLPCAHTCWRGMRSRSSPPAWAACAVAATESPLSCFYPRTSVWGQGRERPTPRKNRPIHLRSSPFCTSQAPRAPGPRARAPRGLDGRSVGCRLFVMRQAFVPSPRSRWGPSPAASRPLSGNRGGTSLYSEEKEPSGRGALAGSHCGARETRPGHGKAGLL